MKLQKPKGTQDILPQESAKWQYLEEFARKTFKKYNYAEIRTPIFEHYEVISRSVGDTTDIVTKEMYDFYDKGDRHITLRPEGTAPVVRSYVENKLFAPEVQKPVKLYYMGSMFRYERPQAGRLREFHQIGVECFGSENPATDAETIAMAAQFFKEIGIGKDSLSKDSQRRLEENPLRVLDSKEKEDKAAVAQAPSILDFLDEESQEHFSAVRSMLESLEIPYVINTNMVRGLDYYNHTIFEFTTDVAGSELTICAGGRYDGLVDYFGGPETPAFGFGMGMERLLLILEKQGAALPLETGLDAYIAVLGEAANRSALELVQALRNQGFAAERDYLDRKLKAQFKSADAFRAKTIITLGESEIESGQVTVKNNETRQEVVVGLDQVQENYQAVLEKLGC